MQVAVQISVYLRYN